MTSINNYKMLHIFEELESLKENDQQFPEDVTTDSLEYISEMDDADEEFGWYVRAAERELNIRKHGFHIAAITEDDDTSEEKRPAFCYTIGMERLGVPEFLTFYPSASSVHWVFHRIYKRMLDAEVQPPATTEDVVTIDGIFEDESLKVALTLLSPEEAEWAYENHTCQVKDEKTPVMLIHIPYPNGQMDLSRLPEELLKGITG